MRIYTNFEKMYAYKNKDEQRPGRGEGENDPWKNFQKSILKNAEFCQKRQGLTNSVLVIGKNLENFEEEIKSRSWFLEKLENFEHFSKITNFWPAAPPPRRRGPRVKNSLFSQKVGFWKNWKILKIFKNYNFLTRGPPPRGQEPAAGK